jgi:hypothetical protein
MKNPTQDREHEQVTSLNYGRPNRDNPAGDCTRDERVECANAIVFLSYELHPPWNEHLWPSRSSKCTRRFVHAQLWLHACLVLVGNEKTDPALANDA